MRYLIFILLVVGFVSFVSAYCDDGQIDINSASLEKLDGLDGIGPVKAQAIIDARPFDSVEDLIDVYGIGEVTLQKIKDQGLACVDGEEVEEVAEEKEEEAEEVVYKNVEENILPRDEVVVEKKVEIISLNDKVVEKKDELVYVSKDAKMVDYLPYGFAVFLIFVIGFLIWPQMAYPLDWAREPADR